MTERISAPVEQSTGSNKNATDAETLAGMPVESVGNHVREWGKVRRDRAILALVANAPAHAAAVASAPTGPDPVEQVRQTLHTAADSFAALVLGAAESFPTLLSDESPETFAANLFAMATTRVEPVAPETLTRRRSTGATGDRTRTNRVRTPGDWSAARGAWNTPGRPGVTSGGTVRISVTKADGVKFTTSDGSTFTDPTAAMRHEDGWGDAKGGWGSPFARMRRSSDRATLGEVVPGTAVES